MNGIGSSATVASPDVRLAAAGDEIAFARLIATHHAELARIAYAIVGERQATEDAVQTTWEIAWRKLSSVRDEGNVRAWLITIAVNEARRIARRNRRASVVEIDVELAGSNKSDPAVGIARIDLARALRRLSRDDRALIALRYLAGFEAAEIGAMTGRSPSGTRTRLSRLTARLREELSR